MKDDTGSLEPMEAVPCICFLKYTSSPELEELLTTVGECACLLHWTIQEYSASWREARELQVALKAWLCGI